MEILVTSTVLGVELWKREVAFPKSCGIVECRCETEVNEIVKIPTRSARAMESCLEGRLLMDFSVMIIIHECEEREDLREQDEVLSRIRWVCNNKAEESLMKWAAFVA